MRGRAAKEERSPGMAPCGVGCPGKLTRVIRVVQVSRVPKNRKCFIVSHRQRLLYEVRPLSLFRKYLMVTNNGEEGY